jgi:hypothetical protein
MSSIDDGLEKKAAFLPSEQLKGISSADHKCSIPPINITLEDRKRKRGRKPKGSNLHSYSTIEGNVMVRRGIFRKIKDGLLKEGSFI